MIARPAIPPMILPTTVGVEGPFLPPEGLEDEVAELGALFVGEGIVPPPAPVDAEELDSLVLEVLLNLEDDVVEDRAVVEFELKDLERLVDGCIVMIVPLEKEISNVDVLVEVVVVSEDSVIVLV